MSDVGATDELVIELSKSKSIFAILGSFGFVAAGYWLFTMDAAAMKRLPINDPLFIHGVGIASMVFFSLTGIIGIRKLFDKRPGLVLNSAGIIDNSSGLAAGFVPWSEITGVGIYEFRRQKMLIIKVRNPEEFIQRGNVLRRAVMKIGSKMSSSPISITSNTLEIHFPEIAFEIQAISPEIWTGHESLCLGARSTLEIIRKQTAGLEARPNRRQRTPSCVRHRHPGLWHGLCPG